MSKELLTPSNVDAEKYLLGSILVRFSVLDDIAGVIKPEYFYRETHKILYIALLELMEKGIKPDLVTMSRILKEKGQLEKVGGLPFLTQIANSVPTSANWSIYADIVYETYLRRQTIDCLNEQLTKAYDPSCNIDDTLSETPDKIASLSDDSYVQKSEADKWADFYANLGKVHNGVKSGIHDLDAIINKFYAKDLTIIAARPSMGKTTTQIQFCINAMKHGQKCLFLSLEMDDASVRLRFMANLSAKDGRAYLAEGKDMTEEVLSCATQTLDENGTLLYEYLRIDDEPCSTSDILRKIRFYKRQMGGLDAVFIDHLGKIKQSGFQSDVNHKLGYITSKLKEFARKEDVAIILASQLNRKVEERNDKHPLLSDLRDSGEIEQNADLVLTLYRNGYYDKENEVDGILEISVMKQRQGETGMVRCRMIKGEYRLENLDDTTKRDLVHVSEMKKAQLSKKEQKAAQDLFDA